MNKYFGRPIVRRIQTLTLLIHPQGCTRILNIGKPLRSDKDDVFLNPNPPEYEANEVFLPPSLSAPRTSYLHSLSTKGHLLLSAGPSDPENENYHLEAVTPATGNARDWYHPHPLQPYSIQPGYGLEHLLGVPISYAGMCLPPDQLLIVSPPGVPARNPA